MAQVTSGPLGSGSSAAAAAPTSTSPPSAAAPASPPRTPPAPDWTVQAADTIESVVGSIRDKTVVPATTVARGLVYGLVAGVLGIVALVLLLVGLFRLVSSYLPWWFADRPGRSVWVTYALFGGIFTLAGLFLLRKANQPRGRTAHGKE